MNEETMPFAQTSKGFIGVDDAGVRDNINSLLTGATSKSFLTPYSALEKVSKVLANYHIFLPKYTFAEGNSGVTAFEVNQFGEKMGMTDQGIVKTAEDSPYFIYFEYQMNDSGMFEVFSEIVTEDELSELMDEYNEEEDEEDDSEEEEVNEEKMTDAEMMKREKIVKSMKKNMAGFKSRYGKDAKNVMYATATKQAMAEDSEHVNEAAKKPSPYHDSYSSAIQTAVSHAKKRGYEVDVDDYQNKVASGPRKPSEGKTVSHNIKLTKDGKPTKKGLAIQIYNKGGETPFELNHYISEETSINEVSKKLLGNYLSKRNLEKGRPGKKKAKSQELAIGKMVNNPKYLKVKVPATEEVEGLDEAIPGAASPALISKEDKHFEKQSKKMQNAINLHLRKGKDYAGAVKAAKVYVKEEVEGLDEVSRGMLSRYISKAKGSNKRKKGVDMALLKKWGDKNYGLPEPKVKATNEENLDEVSKKTLTSYADKARDSYLGAYMSDNSEKKEKREKGLDRAKSRLSGVAMVKKKYDMSEENLDELKKSTLKSYIKKASHDVATKSAATGRYGDRANRARDEFKKGDYTNFTQGQKDDKLANKFFDKSWKRRKGIEKAVNKLEEADKDTAPFEGGKTKKTPNPSKRTTQLAKKIEKAMKKYAKNK